MYICIYEYYKSRRIFPIIHILILWETKGGELQLIRNMLKERLGFRENARRFTIVLYRNLGFWVEGECCILKCIMLMEKKFDCWVGLRQSFLVYIIFIFGIYIHTQYIYISKNVNMIILLLVMFQIIFFEDIKGKYWTIILFMSFKFADK